MGDKAKKRKGLPAAQETSLVNGEAEINGRVQKKARHPKKAAAPTSRCCETAARGAYRYVFPSLRA